MKTIELTKEEINQIKELIYNRIDQVDGYDNLNEELKKVLTKLRN
jgi:hypothetical protein